VRHRQQPGLAGDAERLGELLRTAARLVVRQAEADDPAPPLRGSTKRRATRAEGLGVAGVRVRLAATTSAIPTPVARVASPIASSTSSTVGWSPPSRAA
jgi:hypothetical protein